MSPEQVEASPDVDHRSDLWSMGAILYETLAGVPPFPETSYARLVIAICQRDPTDLASLVPGVPEPLGRVVARALTREREQRFQTADEFLHALAAAMRQEVGRLAASSRAGGARRRSRRRRPSQPRRRPRRPTAATGIR